MSSIFSKIIDRDIPGVFVYEDDICAVLMDKFPSIAGQTLVVPKQEVDYIFDLPDEVYQHLFAVAKKISLASDSAFATDRTCMVIEGFEVPHAHIKIYPVTDAVENFAAALTKTTEKPDEELTEQAQKIAEHMQD